MGLAGLGTVGASVVRLIAAQHAELTAKCGRPVEVVAVSARSRGKDRGIDMKKLRWVADPVELAADPGIDVFVELIGGDGNPARAAVTAALKAGKAVVTANKALLAKHGGDLAALAEKHRVALNFEAAVGGAIPIVKTLREGLAGNAVARIYGILNGTCNYMLTRMERERLSFDECLKEAQRLGYAEADPSFDIEGHDTAQKLSILASLTFGIRVDPAAIYVEASPPSPPPIWKRPRSLAIASSCLALRSRPTRASSSACIRRWCARIPRSPRSWTSPTPSPSMRREFRRSRWLVPARAAWRRRRRWWPTLPILRAAFAPLRSGGLGKLKVSKESADAAPRGRLLHRMLAVDKPGTAAAIAKRLAQHNISMESIVQRHSGPPAGGAEKGKGPVPVILITYATTEDAVRKALAAVQRDKVISGRPQLIRIEKN